MSTRTSSNNRSSNFFPMQQQLKEIQSSSFVKNKQFVSNCYTLQHCDSCTNVFIVKTYFFWKIKNSEKTTMTLVTSLTGDISVCSKLFLLLLFLSFHSTRGEDIEQVFNPDSDEISFQRKYVINVANKAEDCYFIPNVQTHQILNFHFVVRLFKMQVVLYSITQNVIKIWCV